MELNISWKSVLLHAHQLAIQGNMEILLLINVLSVHRLVLFALTIRSANLAKLSMEWLTISVEISVFSHVLRASMVSYRLFNAWLAQQDVVLVLLVMLTHAQVANRILSVVLLLTSSWFTKLLNAQLHVLVISTKTQQVTLVNYVTQIAWLVQVHLKTVWLADSIVLLLLHCISMVLYVCWTVLMECTLIVLTTSVLLVQQDASCVSELSVLNALSARQRIWQEQWLLSTNTTMRLLVPCHVLKDSSSTLPWRMHASDVILAVYHVLVHCRHAQMRYVTQVITTTL